MWNIVEPRDNFLQVPARLPASRWHSRREITNGGHWLPSVTQFLEKQRGRHRVELPRLTFKEDRASSASEGSSSQLLQGLPPYRDALPMTCLALGSRHCLLTPSLPSWWDVGQLSWKMLVLEHLGLKHHWIHLTVWLLPTLPSLLFLKCGSLINTVHPNLHLSIHFQKVTWEIRVK